MSDALGRFMHVHVPPGPGSSDARTLLLLHGTGGNERDLLTLGAAIAPGARQLGVRGQVLEGSMPRFFRRLAEGVFDEADLIVRAAELGAFVAAAAEAYGFDRSTVVAVGYSNGANIAAALLMLHPDVLSGAVLFRAMVPLVPETLPVLHGVPVLMVEGQADAIVPRANAEQLASLLRESGAVVTLHWEPAAHGLTQADVVVARRWFGAQN